MHCHRAGYCAVCEQPTEFASDSPWFRDDLICLRCRSLPRERAFAHCLATHRPDWRHMHLHESGSAESAVSARLRRQCLGHVGTQPCPGRGGGTMYCGYRIENLEALCFADASFDLHCHLDVLKHSTIPTAASPGCGAPCGRAG